MSRPTFPIVFGPGVDRASGTAVATPQALEVAENVVLLRGRVAARKGMGEVRSTLGSAAYIAGGHADRTTLRAIIVAGFGMPGESSHRLEIWTATGSGRDAALLAVWIDPCESMEKARVIACQSGPYVILAHDEPSIDRRAPTVAVDLRSDTVTELSAAWAGGDNKIRFRGVTAWLDYLVGWAFGTNLVDEPHMARISSAVDGPLVFDEIAWLKAGQAGDALLHCFQGRVGLGGALVMRKATDTYIVTGDNFDNFSGPDQIGKVHGLAASRLTCTDGVREWCWSLEGPREGEGGITRDISWPLGLTPWPTADDIAAAGYLDNGFAVYDGDRGIVHFVFHDLVYSYTLEGERWNHERLANPVHCGFILYARTGYEGPSRGYPDFASAVAADADSETVTWTDENPEGDETVEVWVRRSGGSWGASPAATTSISLAPTVTIDGVYAGDYDVAIRYKRDGLYAGAGDVTGQPTYDYTGSPETWPAVSRGTFTVAGVAPSLSALVWSRTSAVAERLALTYASTAAFPIQILRNTVNDLGTASLIHTTAGASGTYNDDAPGTGETTVYYWVRHVYPDTTTGTASSAYPRWIGPDAPTSPAQVLPADYYAYMVEWAAPPSGTTTEVEDDYHCVDTFVARDTTAADATQSDLIPVEKSSAELEDGSELTYDFVARARHSIITFAVTDTSDWATVAVDVLLETPEPEYRTCT